MKRNFHVTPHEDGWAIKREGEDNIHSKHASQEAAIAAAESLALHDRVNVVTHREDGTFRTVRNYANGGGETAAGAGDRPARTVPELQDLVAVGSRVSWSAVLAGAVIALTTYVALSVLGIAVGLTVGGNVEGEGLAIGTLIWAGVSLMVALFLGGFVTSRTTVGENTTEAMTYGLILWGMLFLLLVVLSGLGFDYGVGRALGPIHRVAQTADGPGNGVTDADLVAAGLANDQVKAVQEALRETGSAARGLSATATAWWAFGILVASMIASISGSLVGAGPELVLKRIEENRAAMIRARLRTS